MKRPSLIHVLVATLLASALLSACGIAVDQVPRDIDPQKQEELNNP